MNAITIDTEEWFQVFYGSKEISRDEWSALKPRIQEMIESTLDLLLKHNVLATFFIVGWIAEKYPVLIRKIASHGHEIASHGYWHSEVFRQTPSEFCSDVRRSKNVLEQAIGNSVKGYRAPGYSIGPDQEWALEIIRDAGYVYDSSLLHVKIPFSQILPGLIEIPPNSFKLGKFSLPINGGFFFRVLPYTLYKYYIQNQNKKGVPLIFYTHTWEIFIDNPHIRMKFIKSFIQYFNLHKVQSKLDKMLNDYSFSSIEQIYPSLR